jgi:hypothetical protein
MGKHETTALFMSAMSEAQQIVIDKVDAAIEEAERRGFAMGEAKAFRATVEGREGDVEVLVRYFVNKVDVEHPSREEMEVACDRLRRHFAALRAMHEGESTRRAVREWRSTSAAVQNARRKLGAD